MEPDSVRKTGSVSRSACRPVRWTMFSLLPALTMTSSAVLSAVFWMTRLVWR